MRLWAHWIPAKIRIQSVDFDSRFITLDPPYAGSLKGTIYGNLIAQTMSGGVRFVGGSNRDNIIENNCVHHVGEGIYVRNSVGDVIRHNLIHDVESNGFKSLYVERQTISYNDISRVGLDGTDSDAGGIYTNCTAGGAGGRTRHDRPQPRDQWQPDSGDRHATIHRLRAAERQLPSSCQSRRFVRRWRGLREMTAKRESIFAGLPVVRLTTSGLV